MIKRYFYGLSLLLLATAAPAQVDTIPVDQEKFPGYKPQFNPDFSLLEKSRKMTRGGTATRPPRVNNAETPYFPAIFNQSGNSCSSASVIGYHLTYELNAYRQTDASKDENLLPTHFTWLHYFSSGQGHNQLAANTGVPNIIDYEGRTYSRLFGSQDWRDVDFGWMQGYEKWYHAMFNRTTHSASFPLALNTEEGREAVKNWLWNHCGDTSFPTGGCVNVMLGISTAKQANIPASPVNAELGVVGKGYIHYWGTQLDHQMAIVGYDDRIEFDLDDNGIVGEKDKDEVGAWIIANSWGAGWRNNGFIYCPYACSYTYKNDNGPGGWWRPEVHYVRKDYRPLRTIKVKMEFTGRSDMSLSAGIATDLNATEPETTVGFKHFMYAGDGGSGQDTLVPMLGRWLTGLNYEPMEFGYDLTDLTSQYDRRRALKYFFIIDTKSRARGTGKVHSCSIIDYEFDEQGLEVPFDLPAEGVTVANKGGRTVISCIVPGEPIYVPRNLTSNGTELSWQAPAQSPYKLTGYNIYRNDTLSGKAPADALTAPVDDPDALYTLTAVYDMYGQQVESEKSNRTIGAPIEMTTRNCALNVNNSGFTVPDVFVGTRSSFTMEFWLRPTSLIDWNHHIGPGWGTFLFHANANGSISVGWNTGTNQRLNSPAGVLVKNRWTHVAVVVRGNHIVLYVNGKNVGSISDSSNSGAGGFGSLTVGRVGTQGLCGRMDEFRLWNEARTADQIVRYMKTPISNPTAEKNLLAYYDMEGFVTDGNETRLIDRANGHDAVLLGKFGSEITRVVDLAIGLAPAPIEADFVVKDSTCYQGRPVQFLNRSSMSTVKWAWSVPAIGVDGLNTPDPQFIFPEAGTYDVTLKAYDKDDSVSEKTRQVIITEAPAPNADFAVTDTVIATGDRVGLYVKNFVEGCSYEWTLPGAEHEKVYTTNANAVFQEAGTFVVTLKVTNGSGLSAESSRTIVVSKTAPKSDFRVTPAVVLKGQSVLLQDASTYMPESWSWDLSSSNASIVFDGRYGRIAPSEPGVYTVTQQVTNELGSDVKVLPRGLVVCNADGKTGLNFSGGSEYVEFEAPFTTTKQRTFCIEWWMNASRNTAACHQMGDSEETFLIRANAMGALVVYGRGNAFTSDEGFIIPGEWHHYAVSFSNGSVALWRDGEKLQTHTLTSTYAPVMKKFTLSDANAPLDGIIDELRIWNKAMNETRIQNYSNAPIDDVAAAEQDGLLLYCPFNQNSGNVIDMTSNENTGVRVNFGPEGDAWSTSLGVFSLSNGKPADVTADYLTNYKAPFLHTGNTVTEGARFQELETGTSESAWVLENCAGGTDGTGTTGFYVDNNFSDNLAVMTFTNKFAPTLTDHKAYQTVKLPAGKYKLSITRGSHFDANDSYLVVNAGKGLPDTDNLASALAFAPLAGAELGFALTEETEVSLGFLVNMTGAKYLYLSEISLTRLGTLEVAEPVGVEQVKDAAALITETAPGTLKIRTAAPQRVTVYSAAGTAVFDGQVDGSRLLRVAPGLYIVNGTKISVP